MPIRLSDEARQYLGAFQAVTGASARDCLIEADTITFVVEQGEMGTAIGSHGQTVQQLEDRLGMSVSLVEHADHPESFVANTLAPAAVYEVDIVDREGGTVAIVTVDPSDMGVAIGRDGERIERARILGERHVGITDIEVVEHGTR